MDELAKQIVELLEEHIVVDGTITEHTNNAEVYISKEGELKLVEFLRSLNLPTQKVEGGRLV